MFDEFVMRHELGHDINLFMPHGQSLAPGNRQESVCDAFGLACMYRTHGFIIDRFGETLVAGRRAQAVKSTLYDTASAVAGAATLAHATGLESLRHMNMKQLFAQVSNMVTAQAQAGHIPAENPPLTPTPALTPRLHVSSLVP